MKRPAAVNRKFISLLIIGVFTCLVIMTCVPAPALSEVLHSSSTATDCINRSLNYLRGRQQSDGGFAEPGSSSSEHLTTYIIPAIAAAGEDPRLWTKAGNSPIDFLRTQTDNWTKLTDVERGCLAISSAGVDPRSFNGRNLVAEINANIASDGHIGNSISEHIWGVIALKAASEQLPSNSLGWLKSVQNTDGGFSFSAGSGSDPDDTGAALQAMIVSGAEPDDSAVERAITYLAYCQADDGGFKWKSTLSNTASTAWAVQGIAASGRDAGSSDWLKNNKTPIQYLIDMQQPDGHIKYTSSSDSKPAWMTAEAIPALNQRPYPLNYTPTPLDDDSKDSDSDSSDESSRTTDSTTTSSDDESSDTTAESSLSTDNDSESRSSGTGGGTTVSPSVENDGYVASSGNLAASSGKSIGGGPRSLNLPAFLVFCATYIAVLGLSFLASYLYVRGTRKENPYGL